MTDKTPMTQFIGVPLDELPQTNPPRSYEDIRPYWGEPEGERLFIASHSVFADPRLIDLWKTLVEEARKNPLVTVVGDTVRRVVDDEETQRQIDEKRKEYEKERRTFYRYMNGEHDGKHYLYSVRDYLDRENIEWDAEWAAEQDGEEGN